MVGVVVADLISTRDAARILGVHPSTVSRMVDDGRLVPAETIHGPSRAAVFMFRRGDVEQLAAIRKQAS